MLATQTTTAIVSAVATTITTTTKCNTALNESNVAINCINDSNNLLIHQQQEQQQKEKFLYGRNNNEQCSINNNSNGIGSRSRSNSNISNSSSSSSNSNSSSNSSPSASIKVERRDSTTSDSSLEHLDLGRTPKKLKLNCVRSSDTSTPFHATNNNAKSKQQRTGQRQCQLQCLQESDEINEFGDDDDDNEEEASLSDERHEKHLNSQLLPQSFQIEQQQQQQQQKLEYQKHHHQQQQQHHINNDQTNNNRPKNNNHHFKRRYNGRNLLDKRHTNATCVQLEYNPDNPNSLRKKFRFNHHHHNQHHQRQQNSSDNIITSSNESGFVDGNNSSFLVNNSTTPTIHSQSRSQLRGHNKSANTSSADSTPTHPNGRGGIQNGNTGSVSSPESGVGGGERDDMKYVCPICEVVSPTPHEFTNHIRCHNYASGDTENFTCRICSKVLSSASSLDRHVLVHTGERPFNCKYCHLTFTTNGNMHRHMRTHKQHPHTHHRRNSNGTAKHNHHNSSNNKNTAAGSVAVRSGDGGGGGGANIGHTISVADTINNINAVSTTTNAISQNSVDIGAGLVNNPSDSVIMPLTAASFNGQLNYDEAVKLSQTMKYNNTMNTNSITTDHAFKTTTIDLSITACINGTNTHRINGDIVSCADGSSLTNIENSDESDGGCSSDNSTVNSHMSQRNNHDINNDNDNNNNNNKSNNNHNFTRRLLAENHSDHRDYQEDKLNDATTFPISEELKRQPKITTINNNDIQHVAPSLVNGTSAIMNHDSPKDLRSYAYGFVCPVCNENDFSNMLALDNHMDAQHPDIPAKCKHCDVIFRTHHQLNQHPCTAELRQSLQFVQQNNAAKNLSLKEQYSSTSSSESFKDNNNSLVRSNQVDKDDGNDIANDYNDVKMAAGRQLLERSEFLQQFYMNNASGRGTTTPPPEQTILTTALTIPTVTNQYQRESEQERQEQQQQSSSSSQLQMQASQLMDSKEDDIKSEPSAQDPKDLADIQSILNMTSSSSTSNFLKNFEHNVNTPSSQCSYDKDEEEAQDAFTSEFRKMKLRGEFPCKLCTAVFPNLRALKGHNRVHLSESGASGPFRCNMCPYSNSDKAALVRHMRTHNGDRPYECAVCNYAFTTKANCERHLRNRHAKTTREEVKRAIIYHPSEDSSCDDPTKKIHMFSSPECDDDNELLICHASQPKDRSTPISHLKEMLTAGNENPLMKPVKIQVKSLEQLLDKSPSVSSTFHSKYQEQEKLNDDIHNNNENNGPIDMSMDVLDLSKKAPTTVACNQNNQNDHRNNQLDQISATPFNNSTQDPKLICSSEINEPINNNMENQNFDVTALEKEQQQQQQQLFLAQQQLLTNPTQYLQQLYRNLMLPQLNPFFLPNSFVVPNTSLTELQKFAPFLSHMFNAPTGITNAPQVIPCNNDMDQLSSSSTSLATATTNSNTNNMINPMLPQISPAMCSEKSNSSSLSSSLSSPKDILSSNTTAPINMAIQSLPPPPPHMSSNINVPIKMVLKNGVFMPKQKQRRYRTERPFACEHCSARFTLRSNMERHVKQQHPQYYAQRQRTGHHVMRSRGNSSSTTSPSTVHLNSITQLQAAFANANGGSANGLNSSPSPISDQVKYAILAQQLKARKDTDLLHQALSHGSNNISSNHMFNMGPPNDSGPTSSFNFTNPNTSSTPNGSMEDDDDKLIIDEDGEGEVGREDNVDDVMITNNETENEDYESHIESENQLNLTTNEDVQAKHSGKNMEKSIGTKAKSILEQVIKSGPKCGSLPKPEDALKVANHMPNTMTSLIAQAPAVGKFLQEVASSPFKEESQDLVSVSKLVDNATSNSVSFNNYFRPADLTNHMEHSDEEGLVASGSASESNNSGAEDCAAVATVQPKKKSAYSLAPNRVSCPYCQRMFPWSSSLRRHILTHTGQKPFKCSHCPLLFTTKSNCDRHLLRKHGNIESATSVYVPTEDVTEPIPPPKSVEEIEKMQRKRGEEERERKRKAEKMRREQQHEKERLEMEEREKLQVYQEQNQQQQQQQHDFIKQLAASQLQQQQQQHYAHKSEIGQQISSTDLPFKCHLCESSFAERLLCLEHIKCLHTQEFTLLLSKGAIDSDAETATHASFHEEEERIGNRAHFAGGGGGSSANNHEDGIKFGKYPDYGNRKVICAFCMRRFWSTEDLRRHMRTHSGERPFQCEICLRKFTLKHSMLRHMKKHNDLNVNDGEVEGDGDGDGEGDFHETGDFLNVNANNSGSDYSDEEPNQQQLQQQPQNLQHNAKQSAMESIASAAVASVVPSMINNNPLMIAPNLNASFIGKKIHELLTKANEWRAGNLNGGNGSMVDINECPKPDLAEEIANTHHQPHSDLIGNLLGISDQSMLNKLMSSPDEAAKLLGVEK